jgi:FdhE protein
VRDLGDALGEHVPDVDPVARIAASLARTSDGGIDPLTAVPLLHACREAWGEAPSAWAEGSCPTCGGWPALAEVRGLERRRRLRCGACGADWGFATLRCAFCGVDDPRSHSVLAPEDTSDPRRVDACRACRGYLKSVPSLGAWAPLQVAVEDLDTVSLDLAAIECGWRRPSAPARPIEVEVVPT